MDGDGCGLKHFQMMSIGSSFDSLALHFLTSKSIDLTGNFLFEQFPLCWSKCNIFSIITKVNSWILKP